MVLSLPLLSCESSVSVKENHDIKKCNFLANKTVRLVLGSYVLINLFQNNSCPKPNYKIVYCSLKNTSLDGIGACRDAKYQNFDSFLKKGKYHEKEKFLVNLSNLIIFFSELKVRFANHFPKRLTSILSIAYII